MPRGDSDQSAICDAAWGIDAGRGFSCHGGVCDRCDVARQLRQSHFGKMDFLFSDESPKIPICISIPPATLEKSPFLHQHYTSRW